jgi:hypothetical protein
MPFLFEVALNYSVKSIEMSLIQKLEPFAGQRFSGNTEIFVGLPSGLTWGD